MNISREVTDETISRRVGRSNKVLYGLAALGLSASSTLGINLGSRTAEVREVAVAIDAAVLGTGFAERFKAHRICQQAVHRYGQERGIATNQLAIRRGMAFVGSRAADRERAVTLPLPANDPAEHAFQRTIAGFIPAGAAVAGALAGPVDRLNEFVFANSGRVTQVNAVTTVGLIVGVAAASIECIRAEGAASAASYGAQLDYINELIAERSTSNPS